MATRNMGPTGPIQVQDITSTTLFDARSRMPIAGWGPGAVREASFGSRRHAVGRWKHVMVRPVEYKMRGFNPSTGQYEYWQTNNPSAGPPSGASLTNKSISAVVVDSFPTGE